MNTSNNTNSDTDRNLIMQRYFNMHMRYEGGDTNNQIGQARRKTTVLVVARFGLTSPTVIAQLYGISYRQALEHLNKLVKQNLLLLITTHRSVDGRIYICDADGAKFAEELMSIPVYFRRVSPAERGVNLNAVMHDLILSHILLSMMHEPSRFDDAYYAYQGLMSEKEFKRLFKNTDNRIVDGLILENTTDGLIKIGIEVECSFKNKAQRSVILLKYIAAIKAGVYQKVFLISQSQQIFDDIRRLNTQLLQELTQVIDKKNRKPFLTENDADILKSSIIFRTKYCRELTELFYS